MQISLFALKIVRQDNRNFNSACKQIYELLFLLFLKCTYVNYNHGKKLSGQMRKTALSLTPQAMYNQFKRPYAGSVRELYYIYRKRLKT